MKLYACIGSGNCMKPWLALNQLKFDFELKLVDVLKGEQTTPAYQAVNPRGRVPYLVTDSGEGIGESNAMLWYLCDDTYLMPKDSIDRGLALQWMFFEQTRLEPFISPARFFLHILPDQAEARVDDIVEWQCKAYDGLSILNDHLANQEFMLKSGYCVADIALFGYVHVLEQAGISGEDVPHIVRWIDAVKATEGFQELDDLGHTAANAA